MHSFVYFMGNILGNVYSSNIILGDNRKRLLQSKDNYLQSRSLTKYTMKTTNQFSRYAVLIGLTAIVVFFIYLVADKL